MRLSIASLSLRLGLGFVFLWAGMGKVFAGLFPPFLTDVLDRTGIPLTAPQFALIMGIGELLLGILLVLGLLTRFIGALTAVLLAGIIFTVGTGVEFEIVWKDIALLGMGIALACIGGGSMSIDSALRRDNDESKL